MTDENFQEARLSFHRFCDNRCCGFTIEESYPCTLTSGQGFYITSAHMMRQAAANDTGQRFHIKELHLGSMMFRESQIPDKPRTIF